MRRLVSSVSVTEGHPDKVADQISDAVVDAALALDPEASVACEALVTSGLALVAGEVSAGDGSPLPLDVSGLVRRTLRQVGYSGDGYGLDAETCSVLVATEARPHRSDGRGPGDQAVVYGFATNEHRSYLPQPIAHAHALVRRLAEVRRLGGSPFGPDGSAMVTVEYEGHVPRRVVSVLISTQPGAGASPDDVESAVAEGVLGPMFDEVDGVDDCELIVIPSGSVAPERPHAGCGLSGRKIMVDTYGGAGRHGGGAFSGKGPSKIDRTAAYACRWVAKNLVAAGAVARCEVQAAYGAGRATPVSVSIDTFGTEYVDPARILAAVHQVFDLRPTSIIRDLDLRRPIYAATATYGHVGRSEPWCTWERLDRVDALASEMGLA